METANPWEPCVDEDGQACRGNAFVVRPREPRHELLHALQPFVILAAIGGALAGGSYIAFSFEVGPQFEAEDIALRGSYYTYSQQWGLISLPLATLLGVAVGVSLAFALRRQSLAAVVTLQGVSLFVGFSVASWSRDSVLADGGQAIDRMLYLPLVLGAIFTSGGGVILGMVLAIAAIMSHCKRQRG